MCEKLNEDLLFHITDFLDDKESAKIFFLCKYNYSLITKYEMKERINLIYNKFPLNCSDNDNRNALIKKCKCKNVEYLSIFCDNGNYILFL